MALLIDVQAPDWMSNEALGDFLRPLLPGVDIRCAPELGAASEIDMLACVKLAPGLARALPSLRLVQKLGAGVDAIVGDPELGAQVRVARLRPETPAREIAEYCLACVLGEQRNLRFHAARQGAVSLFEIRVPHDHMRVSSERSPRAASPNRELIGRKRNTPRMTLQDRAVLQAQARHTRRTGRQRIGCVRRRFAQARQEQIRLNRFDDFRRRRQMSHCQRNVI